MNKKIFAILAVVSLSMAALTGVVVAGINPATFGLPNVDLAVTDNSFYNVGSVTGVPGKQASVMCVACHTRNPSARTAYAPPTTGAKADYMGSHFVTRTFADTSKGGGYSDGSATPTIKLRANRSAAASAIYMADNTSGAITGTGAGDIATRWMGLPKYGYLNGGVPDNTYTPRPGTTAQMICESCHNIVHNIGPAKLLAIGFANGAVVGTPTTKGTQTSVLCVGCHGNMNADLNAEWQLHPLTAGTWNGTQHHRNTSGATPIYLGSGTPIPPATHDMGVMDRAYYGVGGVGGQNIGGSLYQMWAAGAGTLGATRAINYTTNTERMKTMADNNQIQPSASSVTCTNCHRAHNADGTAGATILMRGTTAFTTAMGTGPVPDLTTANAPRGLYRMEDKGGRGAAFNSTNPLCLGCHQ